MYSMQALQLLLMNCEDFSFSQKHKGSVMPKIPAFIFRSGILKYIY